MKQNRVLGRSTQLRHQFSSAPSAWGKAGHEREAATRYPKPRGDHTGGVKRGGHDHGYQGDCQCVVSPGQAQGSDLRPQEVHKLMEGTQIVFGCTERTESTIVVKVVQPGRPGGTTETGSSPETGKAEASTSNRSTQALLKRHKRKRERVKEKQALKTIATATPLSTTEAPGASPPKKQRLDSDLDNFIAEQDISRKEQRTTASSEEDELKDSGRRAQRPNQTEPPVQGYQARPQTRVPQGRRGHTKRPSRAWERRGICSRGPRWQGSSMRLLLDLEKLPRWRQLPFFAQFR